MRAGSVADAEQDRLGQTPSVAESIRQWGSSGIDLVSGIVDLAAVEARLAGLSLASIVGLALALALVGMSAWIAFASAAFFWLFDAPAYLPAAALGVGVVSIAGGGLCWMLIRVASRNLEFRATRDVLFAEPTPCDDPAQRSASRGPDSVGREE